MKDYLLFLIIITLPKGCAITLFGLDTKPLTNDTVLTLDNTDIIPILI